MTKLKKDKSIGVFDSGFGGIHILKGIVKELPQFNYIYLGDSARAPYGSRSKEVIYKFTKQAVDFLFENGCEIIILACNTASCYALKKIQRDYLPQKYPGRQVLGVLIPASKEAVEKTKNNKVGVIATEGTVSSGVFSDELKKLKSDIMIFQKACPMLVPLVESGEHNSKAAELITNNYLKSLKTKKIDTLILGCTHYGILENKIRKSIGKDVKIVSEFRAVPKRLLKYLKKHEEIESKLGKNSKITFYSTDLTDKFKILGSKFFGKKIKVKKAELS